MTIIIMMSTTVIFFMADVCIFIFSFLARRDLRKYYPDRPTLLRVGGVVL